MKDLDIFAGVIDKVRFSWIVWVGLKCHQMYTYKRKTQGDLIPMEEEKAM